LPPALPALLAPPAILLALLACVNATKFGSPFLCGYHQWFPDRHLPVGPMLDGLLGMLFSVHWSIFIYFPVLFFALPRLRRFSSEHPWDAALIYSMFGTVLLTLAKIPWWRGEWTYGPRYLLFLLPIAALPALNFAEETAGRPARRQARLSLALAAGVLGPSVWLQFQVNRAPFFFNYEVVGLLGRHMDLDVSEYFLERHEALIYRDLSAGRDNLDRTLLFQLIEERHLLTPDELDSFRRMVRDLFEKQNLYWWPG
jgi:hypothetical protein